jgi:HEAT repeat protein
MSCLVALSLLASSVMAEDGEKAIALYKSARKALSEDDYKKAADLYGKVAEDFPESDMAGDALYWRAFSLYRIGGDQELQDAIESLRRQETLYPDVATKGDAADLSARIYGELAQRGDAEALEWLNRQEHEMQHIFITGTIDGEHTYDFDGDWDFEYQNKLSRAVRRPTRDGTWVIHLDDTDLSYRTEDPQEDIRVAALSTLVEMDPDRAFPMIEKVLQEHRETTTRLRKEALFLASRLRTPEARKLLIDVARTDPDPRVRVDGLLSLSSIPGEEVLMAIEDIIITAIDVETQEAGMVALHHHPSPQATVLLKGFAVDEKLPLRVRGEAIMGLSRDRSPEMLAFLQDLYDDLDHENLKDRLIVDISKFDDARARRWLLDRVHDEEESVDLREGALLAIADDPLVSTDEVIKIYDTSSRDRLRRTAIWMLAHQRTDEARDKLLEIARSESDPDLRIEAIGWLGEIEDPRAVDLLEEILEQ